ncbi:hypothetical protein [Pseudoalteromonas rhizosphaerae]|uniref:hypothetical protein n=1 Tax=Pseudoalteromonas rhizosphaerae TaxID=2518973 RepID=UPI001FEC7DCB|nr:hypothetical protein [Pseudoalteromonas rhizosphaerae]
MTTLNQKENIPSVFTYKYFWLAIAIPVSISLILMCFIWINDRLIPEWPNKNSLDIFLTFMSVPLWILGSSIPLATLATANFRAIQFQENLEYQKRNLERQEFEHKLDLYHKELVLFKEKFEAAIYNGGFKLIRANDATSIYCRFYLKPKSKDDVHNKVDENRVEYIFAFFINFEKEVFTIARGLNMNEMKYELVKHIINDKDQKIVTAVCSQINPYKVKIIVLLLIFEDVLKAICDAIGIKHYSIFKFPLATVFEMIVDIFALQRSLLDKGYLKYHNFFSFERQSHLISIINFWIDQSQIEKFQDNKYLYDDFKGECYIKYGQIKSNSEL